MDLHRSFDTVRLVLSVSVFKRVVLLDSFTWYLGPADRHVADAGTRTREMDL